MNAVTFDTLKCARTHQAAGLPASQAETIADAFREATSEELATKTDLRELEVRLVIGLGAMIAAAVALLGTWVKLP